MSAQKPSRKEMDQLALSLGRVVITCSKLEHEMTMVIAEILSLNEVQERGLVRPMGTSVKITLLNRIARDYLTDEDCKRVTQITDQIKVASEKRNDLVHGLYVHLAEKNAPAVLTFSGASRLKGKPMALSPRHLELFIVNLKWLSGELAALRPLFPKLDKPPALRKSQTKRSGSKPA
ncbi:MAG: hypothetical protein ACM31O_18650 [Bacteroidota bacterium]